MTITYTWEIKSLITTDINENPDTVVEIIWVKTGTNENGVSGSYMGTTRYDPLQIEAANTNMIEFSKLKKNNIIKWISNNIDNDYDQKINNIIEHLITMNKYPKKLAEIPWDKKDQK